MASFPCSRFSALSLITNKNTYFLFSGDGFFLGTTLAGTWDPVLGDEGEAEEEDDEDEEEAEDEEEDVEEEEEEEEEELLLELLEL